MEMTIYKTADDFLEENRKVMEEYSIQANLVWTNATSHKSVEDGFWGVSIMRGDSIYLAIQTAPHPMVHFSFGDNIKEMAKLLAKYLSGNKSLPIKISGIKKTVGIFKDAASGLGAEYTESRHLNLMKCSKVNDIEIAKGEYQSPITLNFDFGSWYMGFHIDCEIDGEMDIELSKAQAKKMTDSGKLVCFSVKGSPVTMAAKKRKLVGGQCVGAVYTPNNLRGKGYSTACIKHLTQEILSEGNDCAFLYADKHNPASNRVYKKVGYKKIADFIEYEKDTL